MSYLIIASIPFIIGFYLPNHPTDLMKLYAYEMMVILLSCLLFMIGPRRNIKDIFPGLLLIYFLINCLTHYLGGNTIVSLAMCTYFTFGVYAVMNGLEEKHIPIIYKTIIWFGLANLISFLLEKKGIQAPFIDQGIYNSNRASGFMIYPAHFALLMAICTILTYKVNKFLSVPFILGLFLVNELSINIGLIICLFIEIRNSKWIYVILPILLFVFVNFHKSIFNYIEDKGWVRFIYWRITLEQCFTRIIDGWGFGSYSYIINELAKTMPKDYFRELHNELLQGWFEGGVLFITLLGFWFNRLKKMIYSFKQQKHFIYIFIVFLTTSMGHSIFHFCDCLWLFVILYALFHVEHFEADKKWNISNAEAS